MRCSPSATGNGLAAYASRMLAIVRCQDWRRRRNPARAITESAVPRSPSDAGSGMVPVSEKAALKVGAGSADAGPTISVPIRSQSGSKDLIPGPALEIGKSRRERRARRDDRFGGGQPEELPARSRFDLRNEKVVIGRQNQRRRESYGELHLCSGHRTIAVRRLVRLRVDPTGLDRILGGEARCSVLVVKVRSPGAESRPANATSDGEFARVGTLGDRRSVVRSISEFGNTR